MSPKKLHCLSYTMKFHSQFKYNPENPGFVQEQRGKISIHVAQHVLQLLLNYVESMFNPLQIQQLLMSQQLSSVLRSMEGHVLKCA